jgi:hypothetical protein
MLARHTTIAMMVMCRCACVIHDGSVGGPIDIHCFLGSRIIQLEVICLLRRS